MKWKQWNKETGKEQGRIGLLLSILFCPCLFTLFTATNLQLSDTYNKQHPQVYEILSRHRSSSISSSNLFHTMIDIGNITYPNHHSKYSIASLCFKEDSIRSVLKPDDTILHLH